MEATIVYDSRESKLASAAPDGDHLWLSLADLGRATGWEVKPQGVCRGETCVPVPKGAGPQGSGWTDEKGGRFDLAGFARHLRQPVVHDDESSVWVFGAAPGRGLSSAEAPDFALPDLDGNVHRLSDYRGKKVFLFCWASW
ncbi:MAG: hypothetical protein QOD06_6 [Candidatus Binatota bacterium]|jgi:hypothetical protein|nr:hypothetical protein [Candidatus Binatota bacterium]